MGGLPAGPSTRLQEIAHSCERIHSPELDVCHWRVSPSAHAMGASALAFAGNMLPQPIAILADCSGAALGSAGFLMSSGGGRLSANVESLATRAACRAPQL